MFNGDILYSEVDESLARRSSDAEEAFALTGMLLIGVIFISLVTCVHGVTNKTYERKYATARRPSAPVQPAASVPPADAPASETPVPPTSPKSEAAS